MLKIVRKSSYELFDKKLGSERKKVSMKKRKRLKIAKVKKEKSMIQNE